MPNATTPSGTLLDLPNAARGISLATAQAGREMIEASARDIDLAGGAPPGVVAIRSVRAEVRMTLDRDGEKVILFFFKRPLPEVRSMNARLHFAMMPALATGPGAPPAAVPGAPIHYLLPPRCVVLSPTKEDLQRFGPPGTTTDNGVLLRIGPSGAHALAIKSPDSPDDAEVAYTIDQKRVLQRPFLAKPFLDMVEALRTWVAGEDGGGAAVRIALPEKPAGLSHVKQILHSVAAAYAEADRAARGEAESLPEEAWGRLVPRYEPADFGAEIQLRLDGKGMLAGPEVEEPVRIGLRMRVAPEMGAIVARTELRPADFLAEGPLFDVFVAAVRQQVTGELLDSLKLSEEEWGGLVDSAAGRIAVFRIGGDAGADVDLVVLPGLSLGRARTLVVRLKAVVDAEAQPPTVEVSELTRVHDSMTDGGSVLEDEVAAHFLTLAASLRGWLSLAK